jgi:hypothetical protein
MHVINITRPNEEPQEGDWVRYVYDNGDTVEKQYHTPPSPEVVAERNHKIKLDNEKAWRNSELAKTDLLILLPDYPYKEQLTVYRQALRDWPSTTDFPDTRPELGE